MQQILVQRVNQFFNSIIAQFVLGITGHTGSNGSTMQSRLEKYGDWMGSIGENIEFGGKSGREIVISLIVDDGVASRGHRTNLFSSNFLKAGVACYSHK